MVDHEPTLVTSSVEDFDLELSDAELVQVTHEIIEWLDDPPMPGLLARLLEVLARW